MKLKFLFTAFVFAAFSSASFGAAAKAPKLIVTILVDQLRYDYMQRFHDQFSKGGFKLLTDQGAFMTMAEYNYSPTITGPGHASFLSGSTPLMHGIIGNDWFDKRAGEMVYCVEDKGVTGVGTRPEAKAGHMSPKNFIGATFADQARLHWGSKVVGISVKDRGAILPAGKKPLGAYWFEPATGNFITSSYYMAELPAWVKAFNDRKLPESYVGQSWERLLDAKAYQYPDDMEGESALPGEKARTFPHKVIKEAEQGYEPILSTPFGNQLLAEFAKAAIEGEKLGQSEHPDLLCVSFSSVDYCGHRFGPYSQEVQDIVLRLDQQLEGLFGYLGKSFGLDNVTIVLTADHAVAPTPESAKNLGLDGDRVDTSALMDDLQAKVAERFGPGRYFLSPKGSLKVRLVDANLYYDHAVLREKQITPDVLTTFIREWAFDTGKFHAVYGREQLLEGRAPGAIGQRVMNGFNGERSGDVVFVMKPFALPGGGKSGTTHGSAYTYDTHVPVMFYGAAFQPGRYADEFNITDIVPTLSAGLGIQETPSCMGKALVKALR